MQDKNWTKFNSLQVDLRRRLAQGLLVSANYTYGIRRAHRSLADDCAVDRASTVDNTDVPHVFKLNWYYEMPVGRGRRFGIEHEPDRSTASSATGSSPATAACRRSATGWWA